MKKQLAIALSFALLVGTSVFADFHKVDDILRRFVAAWNAHDAAQMSTLWTADAQVADVLGRTATGRAGATGLFAQGASTFKLTGYSAREIQKGTSIVEFAGEVSGLRSLGGALLPAMQVRFTAVMTFGPDLPGGHHPEGRYFIKSLTSSPVR